MHRKYSYLEYKKALLHYSEYGNGKNILICFHGYGQSSAHFAHLEEALKNDYTIYSFDLFYHGQSFWHEKDKPISKEFWEELISRFVNQKKIDRFDVLGFSMGGKFAMATLEKFYKRIDKLILVAPDGIKINFWYRFATSSKLMRKIFRRVIMKPDLYISLIRFLAGARILNKKVVRFADSQMATRQQRRKAYYSWVVFRDLKFRMEDIAEILNHNSIKLEMFLGEYDRIITQQNMKGLLDILDDYQITVLPSGHSTLLDAVGNYYADSGNKNG